MTQSDDRQANTEPSRLLAGDAGDPVFEELGRWFAAVPPPPGLDAAGLARVAQRLDGATRR